MKISSKRLVSILLCLALALALLPFAAFASDTQTVYLNAGGSSLWDQDGAWFATWAWADDGEGAWYTGTDSDGDGTYEFEVPSDANNIIFARMSSDASEPNWDDVWNQTGNLTIDDECYTITGWGEYDGEWAALGDAVVPETTGIYISIDTLTVVGASNTGDEGAISGGFLNGAVWDPYCAENVMTETGDGEYTITYTDVAADEYSVKFAANSAWEATWGTGGVIEPDGSNYQAYYNGMNSTFTVDEDGSTVIMTVVVDGVTAISYGASVSIEVIAPESSDNGADVKWQVSKGTNADSETTDLRLVTYVDSLDYEAVTFNVTRDGVTKQISCTTVYEAIYADGLLLESAADVFGTEDAAYFATLVIEGVPADEFDSEISVSITWEGETDAEDVTSEARTIVISSDWA